MARNIFQAFGDMWAGGNSDSSDADLRSKRPGETNEEYRARVSAATDKAKKNIEDFKEAKRTGVIDNGMSFDDYLIASGKATDIKVNDDGSAEVNGKHMSAEEYDNWYNNTRR